MLMKVNFKSADLGLTAKSIDDMFDECPLSCRPKRTNSGHVHFRRRSWSAFVAAVPAGDLALLVASVNWRPKCDFHQAMQLFMLGFQVCL